MTTATAIPEAAAGGTRRMHRAIPHASCVVEPVGALADALARLYAAPVAAPLPSKPMPAATGEQRGFPRRTAEGFVSLARSDRPAELSQQETDRLLRTSGLTGELVDLSRSGLALVLLQPFAVGEIVVIRLSQLENCDVLDAIAEVVRCVDLGDQRWKITARFAQPLGFDEAYEFAQHELETVATA